MVLDIRKSFEYDIGTFKGAVNPKINNFREFKEFFSKDFIKKNKKKLAIFVQEEFVVKRLLII